MGLKTELPDLITCPECERLGQDWSNVAHFWKFNDVVVERNRRWLLGFVCEGHHHFVIELDCHSAGMWVSRRVVGCPDPASCRWNLWNTEDNVQDTLE